MKPAWRWAVPFLALGAIVLSAVPAAVWHHPSVDAVQTGFDPNLMYASNGAVVSSAHAALTVPTKEGSKLATINLVGTPLRAFSVSFDVVGNPAAGGGVPFRVGLWSPWTQSGYFLQFNATLNQIETQVVIHGQDGSTLVGGQVIRVASLGPYVAGDLYRVRMDADKDRAFSVAIAGGGVNAEDSVTEAAVPDLFASRRVALTVSALASTDTTGATLTNYTLTLPHQAYWADRIDDRRALVAELGLLVLAAIAVATACISWFVRAPKSLRIKRLAPDKRVVWVVVSVVLAYVAGNALLFPLGGHPFDFGNEKLYAYVARVYGPAHLYYVPSVVSLARVWGGVPFVEAAFPYEPVSGYLYVALGWLGSVMFAGGGAFGLADARVDYLLKATNVLFGLADGGLIFLILRQLKTTTRWSAIAALLFVFNPAVWFSMSVWGQTHVISLFLVLLAVLLTEKGRPGPAWLALAAATLTRPQMFVFALILGMVLLRRFSWRQNLSALSWTVVLVFLLLAPFTLATSPSLPVDIMRNNLSIQQGGTNEVALTTVSQDAYSIWPFVTYVFHGASGLARTFTPSSSALVGSLTYQRLGQVLTIAALLLVSAAVLLKKRVSLEAGGYIPWLTLGIASFLMLLTGVVATHFLLALPFLLLCRRWMGATAYLYIFAIWTVTTLVPMYGDMGAVLSPQDYPLLAPATNTVTRFFVDLYSWDRFITVAVVANICAVAWLAYLSLRTTESRPPRFAAATD